MAISKEINDIFSMMTAHPEEIANINLFIKLKNGTIFRYKVDCHKQAKIDRILELRKLKEEHKRKLKEEKFKNKITKKTDKTNKIENQ